MSRWMRATLLIALLATDAAAQTVRGTLTEEGTGTPIAGALVVILPPGSDSVRSGVLTDPDGTFSLRTPPGRWRLRADRIGHASVHSDPFEVAAGADAVIHLTAPMEAIQLDRLDVTAESRGCEVRPEEGRLTARVWDEARKALQNALWAVDREVVRYETVLHERALNPGTLAVRSETVVRRTGGGARPFASPPPSELVERGFVQATDSGTYYFAPDEAVLLSDPFLDTHCFGIQTSSQYPSFIGLMFEPGRRSRRADIGGVLWLDALTLELRFLEYRYRNLELDVPTHELGGRVDFQRLPTGAWIPRRWWIRMPEIELQRSTGLAAYSETPVLTGIWERGGEVVAVVLRGGRRIERLDRPRVQGVVYDSIQGHPLAGATVFLLGTDHRTRTDEQGRFMLTAGAGRYDLAFHHPRLDSLRFTPPPRPVSMEEGVVQQARLAVPSQHTILEFACRAFREGGVLAGRVHGAGGEPLGARVRLSWQTPAGDVRVRSESAGEDGRFLFCEVPFEVPLYVSAQTGDRASEPRRLQVTAGDVATVALEVDALPVVRVTGQIVSAETGEAVEGAVVRLPGAGLQTLTTDDGRFALGDVTPGVYLLELQHVAYGVRTDSLRVAGDSTTTIRVALAGDVIRLEPLVATAERRYATPGLAGFYERRSDGIGRFFTADQIEARQPRNVSDVLRAIPGLDVRCGMHGVTSSGCTYRFERVTALRRGGGDSVCPIQFFLDGTHTSQDVVDLVRPEQIEGIEVYNGLADVPPRFLRGPNTRCGVIAMWLRSRG